MTMHSLFLETPLCRILGIDYPIMSAGMNDCAGPELVAAVSNAGGLGSARSARAAPTPPTCAGRSAA